MSKENLCYKFVIFKCWFRTTGTLAFWMYGLALLLENAFKIISPLCQLCWHHSVIFTSDADMFESLWLCWSWNHKSEFCLIKHLFSNFSSVFILPLIKVFRHCIGRKCWINVKEVFRKVQGIIRDILKKTFKNCSISQLK